MVAMAVAVILGVLVGLEVSVLRATLLVVALLEDMVATTVVGLVWLWSHAGITLYVEWSYIGDCEIR